MVNHYIPQSDGTFRRSAMAEPTRRPAPKPVPPPPPAKPEPVEKPCPPPPPAPPQPSPGPLQFLRRLIPKDVDAEDLVIIALLLLLSSREEDDDLAPLLTIALYFLL